MVGTPSYVINNRPTSTCSVNGKDDGTEDVSVNTLAAFLIDSRSDVYSRGTPRQQFSEKRDSPDDNQKQESASAIEALNQFIFQAGNIYHRGKRLSKHEEIRLRDAAKSVGLSMAVVDTLIEQTADSNAIVKYCMVSDDTFARKIMEDSNLARIFDEGSISGDESNFTLADSVWRVFMLKIIQQFLKEHNMKLGDIMKPSSLTCQLYKEAVRENRKVSEYDKHYTSTSDLPSDAFRIGRDFTQERKQLSIPPSEARKARQEADAMLTFYPPPKFQDSNRVNRQFQRNVAQQRSKPYQDDSRDDHSIMLASEPLSVNQNQRTSIEEANMNNRDSRDEDTPRQNTNGFTPYEGRSAATSIPLESKSYNSVHSNLLSNQADASKINRHKISEPNKPTCGTNETVPEELVSRGKENKSGDNREDKQELSAVKRGLELFNSLTPSKGNRAPSQLGSMSRTKKQGSSSRYPTDPPAVLQTEQEQEDATTYRSLDVIGANRVNSSPFLAQDEERLEKNKHKEPDAPSKCSVQGVQHARKRPDALAMFQEACDNTGNSAQSRSESTSELQFPKSTSKRQAMFELFESRKRNAFDSKMGQSYSVQKRSTQLHSASINPEPVKLFKNRLSGDFKTTNSEQGEANQQVDSSDQENAFTPANEANEVPSTWTASRTSRRPLPSQLKTPSVSKNMDSARMGTKALQNIMNQELRLKTTNPLTTDSSHGRRHPSDESEAHLIRPDGLPFGVGEKPFPDDKPIRLTTDGNDRKDEHPAHHHLGEGDYELSRIKLGNHLEKEMTFSSQPRPPDLIAANPDDQVILSSFTQSSESSEEGSLSKYRNTSNARAHRQATQKSRRIQGLSPNTNHAKQTASEKKYPMTRFSPQHKTNRGSNVTDSVPANQQPLFRNEDDALFASFFAQDKEGSVEMGNQKEDFKQTFHEAEKKSPKNFAVGPSQRVSHDNRQTTVTTPTDSMNPTSSSGNWVSFSPQPVDRGKAPDAPGWSETYDHHSLRQMESLGDSTFPSDETITLTRLTNFPSDEGSMAELRLKVDSRSFSAVKKFPSDEVWSTNESQVHTHLRSDLKRSAKNALSKHSDKEASGVHREIDERQRKPPEMSPTRATQEHDESIVLAPTNFANNFRTGLKPTNLDSMRQKSPNQNNSLENKLNSGPSRVRVELGAESRTTPLNSSRRKNSMLHNHPKKQPLYGNRKDCIGPKEDEQIGINVSKRAVSEDWASIDGDEGKVFPKQTVQSPDRNPKGITQKFSTSASAADVATLGMEKHNAARAANGKDGSVLFKNSEENVPEWTKFDSGFKSDGVIAPTKTIRKKIWPREGVFIDQCADSQNEQFVGTSTGGQNAMENGPFTSLSNEEASSESDSVVKPRHSTDEDSSSSRPLIASSQNVHNKGLTSANSDNSSEHDEFPRMPSDKILASSQTERSSDEDSFQNVYGVSNKPFMQTTNTGRSSSSDESVDRYEIVTNKNIETTAKVSQNFRAVEIRSMLTQQDHRWPRHLLPEKRRIEMRDYRLNYPSKDVLHSARPETPSTNPATDQASSFGDWTPGHWVQEDHRVLKRQKTDERSQPGSSVQSSHESFNALNPLQAHSMESNRSMSSESDFNALNYFEKGDNPLNTPANRRSVIESPQKLPSEPTQFHDGFPSYQHHNAQQPISDGQKYSNDSRNLQQSHDASHPDVTNVLDVHQRPIGFASLSHTHGIPYPNDNTAGQAYHLKGQVMPITHVSQTVQKRVEGQFNDLSAVHNFRKRRGENSQFPADQHPENLSRWNQVKSQATASTGPPIETFTTPLSTRGSENSFSKWTRFEKGADPWKVDKDPNFSNSVEANYDAEDTFVTAAHVDRMAARPHNIEGHNEHVSQPNVAMNTEKVSNLKRRTTGGESHAGIDDKPTFTRESHWRRMNHGNARELDDEQSYADHLNNTERAIHRSINSPQVGAFNSSSGELARDEVEIRVNAQLNGIPLPVVDAMLGQARFAAQTLEGVEELRSPCNDDQANLVTDVACDRHIVDSSESGRVGRYGFSSSESGQLATGSDKSSQTDMPRSWDTGEAIEDCDYVGSPTSLNDRHHRTGLPCPAGAHFAVGRDPSPLGGRSMSSVESGVSDKPQGATREELDLLNRFIEVAACNFDGKKLSEDSEARVRSAALNVGLSEMFVDQLVEQANMKNHEKEANLPQSTSSNAMSKKNPNTPDTTTGRSYFYTVDTRENKEPPESHFGDCGCQFLESLTKNFSYWTKPATSSDDASSITSTPTLSWEEVNAGPPANDRRRAYV